MRWRKSLPLLAPIVGGLLLLSGVAVAGTLGHTSPPTVVTTPPTAPSPSPSPQVEPSGPPDSADSGVHGGPVARMHDGCDVPDGVTLDGNWTHGDYVSAWAHQGDPTATQTAAQSDCGKPMSAVHDASTAAPGKSGDAHGKSAEPHGKSADAPGRASGSHAQGS